MATTYTSRKAQVVAHANRVLLTGISATTILTYTPQRTTKLQIDTYFSVKTAATDVTITLAYTDPDAGAVTPTLLSLTSEPAGAYPQNAVSILAQGGSAVEIEFTAGTANQVTASAAITDKT